MTSCRRCVLPVDPAEAVLCSSCRAVHHAACWREGRGCATDGCGSRVFEQGDEADGSSNRSEPTSLTWFEDEDGGLVVDTKGSDAEGLLALGSCCGGSILLAGLVVALASWLSTTGWLLFLGCLAPLVVISAGLRRRLRFDPVGGAVSRATFLFDRRVSHDPGFLFLDEVAELHLHEIRTPRPTSPPPADGPPSAQPQPPTPTWRLAALVATGEIRLLAEWRGSSSRPATDLAERLARMANCMVRRLEGEAPPSPAEVAQVLRLWRSEAPNRLSPGPR